jgi:hypothetical protein
MSGPKRGMVAGQKIQTTAQTEEWDVGYDRIFGKDRKPQRGRFLCRGGELVPVDADWTDAELRAQYATEELTYGGARATDGTPINSRKRHREYLKSNGLTHASDFSPEYRERTIASRERHEEKEIRQIVDRDVHKVFGG